MQIYLARNNEQAGPYSLEQLNNMLANQQVLLTDLVWHQGMQHWKPLGELTHGQVFYNPHGTAKRPQPKLPTFATIMQRTLAKVLDLLLWLPIFAMPSFFMTSEAKQQLLALQSKTITADMQAQVMSLVSPQAWQAMAIYALVMLAIQAILLSKTGQSIGKRLVGIQIVDANNYEPVSLTRIFLLRSIVFVILNMLFFPIITIIDYVFALSAKKQALHDKLATTIVIKKAKK